MENKVIFIRTIAPTEADQAPYKTECRVPSRDAAFFDLYVQISKDPEKPLWELVDNFSVKLPEARIQEVKRAATMEEK